MKKVLLIFTLLTGFIFAQSQTFILAEGNFGSSNSSLWSEDGTGLTKVSEQNSLGDVGQSLTIFEDKVYAIMNNSHSIEIFATQDGNTNVGSISLPGSSPRYMEVVGGIGYVSCWGLSAILSIDLAHNQVLDTIEVGGIPEDILSYDQKLYTSINQVEYMGASDSLVLEIDLAQEEPLVTDSFEVVKGPGQMILKEHEIWVASTYYDESYMTYAGMTKINLKTGSVTKKDYGMNFNFSNDLIVNRGRVFRTHANGVVELESDLSYDANQQIGDLPAPVYSAANNGDKLYIGTTSDYTGPDSVFVMNFDEQILDTLVVGACPGSFAFYTGPAKVSKQNNFANDFRLEDNFPNPFNSQTVISYYLPERQKVKLTIYNILGEKVTELINTAQASGYHNMSWNGANNSNDKVASGVYFYRLQTPTQSVTKKMLYVK